MKNVTLVRTADRPKPDASPPTEAELLVLQYRLHGRWRFVKTGLEFAVKAVFRSPCTGRALAVCKAGPLDVFYIIPARELAEVVDFGMTEYLGSGRRP